MTQAKSDLQQLQLKITHLQKKLTQTQNKHNLLTRELHQNQTLLTENLHKLGQIQQHVLQKQQQITQLEAQIKLEKNKLNQQQELLAKIVRTRYSMGVSQASWMKKPVSPQQIQRIRTYYQYAVRSHQQLMHQVQIAQQKLLNDETRLKSDLEQQQQLQQQLIRQKESYEHNQHYQKTLLQSLTQHMHQDKQTLATYRRNQITLTRLLTNLVRQSVIQTKHPLTSMRKKLPKPLAVHGTTQRMNQGVLFLAKLGTPIHAIYPGKVVFADWLNGYGLLLIVDHGWGFMSLYANNQALYKQKGDVVNQGEQIATVGHSGGFKQNSLYFEIRHRGKAIPPLEWLS